MIWYHISLLAIELENVTFKMGVYTLQKEIKWEAAIRRKLQQMTLIFLIVILLYLDKKKPTTISVTKTMMRMTKMNRMKTLCYWPWAVDLQQVTYLKESTFWMVCTYDIYTIRFLIIWQHQFSVLFFFGSIYGLGMLTR